MANPMDDVHAELRLAGEADGEEELRRLLAAQEKLRLLREGDAVDEADALSVGREIGRRLREYQERIDDEPAVPGGSSPGDAAGSSDPSSAGDPSNER